MLKDRGTFQRGSQTVKKITKAAKQAHSVFVAADALAGHVQHNKAFSQNTRDNAKNARYVTETLRNVTGSSASKSMKNMSGGKFKPTERKIPVHPHGLTVPKSSNPTDAEVMAAIMANERRGSGKGR